MTTRHTRYYVPLGKPEYIDASSPMAAVLGSNIWEDGGWAAAFTKNPRDLVDRHGNSSFKVHEVDEADRKRHTHYVPIIEVINTLHPGWAMPAGRLEDY